MKSKATKDITFERWSDTQGQSRQSSGLLEPDVQNMYLFINYGYWKVLKARASVRRRRGRST